VPVHDVGADRLGPLAPLIDQEASQYVACLVGGPASTVVADQILRGGEQGAAEVVARAGGVLPQPADGGAQQDRRAKGVRLKWTASVASTLSRLSKRATTRIGSLVDNVSLVIASLMGLVVRSLMGDAFRPRRVGFRWPGRRAITGRGLHSHPKRIRKDIVNAVGNTISRTFLCILGHMAATEPRPRRPEVSEGMAAARQRGVRLGRPKAPVPESARRAAELRDQGMSLAQIAAALEAERVPTPSGKGRWGKSNVQYVLARWDRERGDGQRQ
jgi:hypothetical protein